MTPVPAPVQPSQDLCLSCGLCCDGTIFKKVEIDNLDTILGFKAAGIDFHLAGEVEDGKHSFMQPCAALDAGCCKIYADRPLICRQFECNLLRAYLKNKKDYAAASEIVKKTKDRKSEILKRIAELNLPLKSTNVFFDLHDEAFEFFKSLAPGELKTQCGDIVLQITALRFFISANFKNFEGKIDSQKNGGGTAGKPGADAAGPAA